MKIDVTQVVTANNQLKTDIQVQYHRVIEKATDLYTCVLTLTNGFKAVGQVEKTYFANMTDAQGFSIAQQRALDVVARRGYSLV